MVLRVATSVLLAAAMCGAQNATTPAGSSDTPVTDSTNTPPPLTCPAGAPIGAVSLRVRTASHADTLPFQTINHLTEGDEVLYTPVLRGHENRPGEVSLVMVAARRQPKEPALIATDPKAADKPQSWKIPHTLSMAALVYGPQGLSKKKVEGFLSQDDLLVAQLADYAEKTAQTEALLETLSNAGSSSASVNAALTGFASQYGLSVQLDKTATPATQAQTLFATMNPQLATYNPLASSTAERAGQTASLASAAATLFFGSPIGLAAGGTAMLLDLRYIAFPGTQFRSSFAQPANAPNAREALKLCGQNTPAPPHTRVAYVWAVRIPNTPTPAIQIGSANYAPATQKTPVPVTVSDQQWKYLQRARAWTLVDAAGHHTSLTVLKLGNQRAVELDLTKATPAAGDYHLAGYWDWAPFQAAGVVHIQPLSDFHEARLEPKSQDRLEAKTGKVAVTLTNSDFQFLTKTEIKRLNDEFSVAEPARFLLPRGLREGPQKQVDMQIDTGSLEPGPYELLLTQVDGKSHAVPVRVLVGLPAIANLPIQANQGEATQHYVLKGERLDEITELSARDAAIELSPAAAGAKERAVTVQLKSAAKPGTKLAVEARVAERSEPMVLANGLLVTGPLPSIASSRLSPPSGTGITLPPDEFPAGYSLTALLDVRNVEARSQLTLACAEDIGGSVSLHVGEQNTRFSLQRLSADQLFLSADTGGFPAGCELQAVVSNGDEGQSQPYRLAHLVRLPHVEAFGSTTQLQADGKRIYTLTGNNLEMIEKVGWDDTQAIPVVALPTPVPGQGQKQELQVTLPEPAPAGSMLYVWLRGAKKASATTISAAAPVGHS